MSKYKVKLTSSQHKKLIALTHNGKQKVKEKSPNSIKIANFHHEIQERTFVLTDNQYQQLQEACFKHWLSFESQAHLFEIISIIQQCWSIHSVLGEYRLIKSIDQSSFEILRPQGRLANNLRYWIEQY